MTRFMTLGAHVLDVQARIPALDIEVVGTTGCGDVFSGAGDFDLDSARRLAGEAAAR